MRPGIRLQLVLALGALLVLAFVPLFFAVSSLTRASMATARASSARALGRAVAGYVLAAEAQRPPGELRALLEEPLGPEGVAALAVYNAEGQRVEAAGEEDARAALPGQVEPGRERIEKAHTAHGNAILVVVPARVSAALASAAVVVRADPDTTPVAPLVRLVALYTGVVALALLVFAYFALTRLIVQPLDDLSRAAGRVVDGARSLDVPRRGARELLELGQSLARMTERLRADEEALRAEEEALRAKVAEAERYANDLSRAQETLIRSERLASVGRLAAGLAHEIGNPIAAILGFQELLLAGGLEPDEERDFIERMKRETERIHRILRDLLDFARPAPHSLRQGALGLELFGRVADAAADVLSLVRPQKAFRDVALDVDIAPDLPPVRLAGPRLVQVLLNLLLNAAAAVPEVGGRITLRAARLGSADGDHVRIEIEDNGPGIAPEVRVQLFEPFVTTKEVGKGTGLGLAVCRGLIDSAGGVITLDEKSDLGGARFVIDLPAAPDETKDA